MDILEVIKTRRSIRKYTPNSISEQEINKILEAGRWAPSASNSQPWKFVVLRDPERRKRLADMLTWGKFLSQAVLGIAVTINPKASECPVQDGAAATQNMLLEAHSLSLGACWIGIYDSEDEACARKVLNIPEGERLLSIIAIGHPAETPQGIRRRLAELAFVDEYGKR